MLEINFEDDDYSIEEGGTLNSVIRLQFRQNQNPFTVRLCPVSIDTAEDMNLGSFIDSDTIDEISRATPGGLLLPCSRMIVGTSTFVIFFTVSYWKTIVYY